MIPGTYVVYRIHATGLGEQAIMGAHKHMMNAVPCNYCTSVIPSTKKKFNGEVRARLCTFWRGDDQEESWQENLKAGFDAYGITPVIEVAPWVSKATLAWEDEATP